MCQLKYSEQTLAFQKTFSLKPFFVHNAYFEKRFIPNNENERKSLKFVKKKTGQILISNLGMNENQLFLQLQGIFINICCLPGTANCARINLQLFIEGR